MVYYSTRLLKFTRDELKDADNYISAALHCKNTNPIMAKTFYEMGVHRLECFEKMYKHLSTHVDEEAMKQQQSDCVLEMWHGEASNLMEWSSQINYKISLYRKF